MNGKTSVAAIVAGASAATNAASAAAAVAGTEPALTNGDAEKEVPSKKALLINGLNGNGVKSVHLNDLLDDDDDDELDFEDLDNDALSSDNDGKTDTPSLSSSGSSHAGGDSGSTLSETPSGKSSPSAFPDPMTGAGAVNNVITTGSTTTAPTTSTSSSISPPSAEEVPPVDSSAAAAAMTNVPSSNSPAITNGISSSSSSILSSLASDDKQQASSEHVIPSSASLFGQDVSNMTTTTATMSTGSKQQQPLNGMAKINSVLDNATSRFSKLGFFDDNSSFFSHSTFDPYSFTAAAANKLDQAPSTNLDGIQSSGLTSSQLPDLLSGTNDTNEQHTKEILKNLGNLQQQQHQQQQQQQQHHLLNNVHLQQQLNGLGLGNASNGGVDGLVGLGTGNTDDWEAAFSKYVMRSKLDVEHHEELMRMQELQKRNLINTGLSSTQFNGFNGEYSDYFHNTNELNSRLLSQQQQQAHQRLQQQQQQQQQHTDMSHIYAGNMSKFFDFHKSQQQAAQQQQQSQPPAGAGPQPPFLQHNGHSALGATDPMSNIANLLENSRLNSHFLEQHTNGKLESPVAVHWHSIRCDLTLSSQVC